MGKLESVPMFRFGSGVGGFRIDYQDFGENEGEFRDKIQIRNTHNFRYLLI